MIIYKDVFTCDELFSDAFPVELVDEFLYQIKGTRLQKKVGGENYGVSANVDEDATEGATADGEESQTVEVIDVVDSMRLQACVANDKKSYIAHIKDYMKALKEKLGEDNPSRVPVFEKKAQEFVKSVIGEFDKYELFTGENMFHPDTGKEGMVVLMKDNAEGRPIFFAFKDGITSEKY